MKKEEKPKSIESRVEVFIKTFRTKDGGVDAVWIFALLPFHVRKQIKKSLKQFLTQSLEDHEQQINDQWEIAVKYNVDEETLKRIELALKSLKNHE